MHDSAEVQPPIKGLQSLGFSLLLQVTNVRL